MLSTLNPSPSRRLTICLNSVRDVTVETCLDSRPATRTPKRKPFGTENLPSLAVIAHVSIVNPDPSAAQFILAPRGLRFWLFRRSVRSRRVKASRPVFADKVVPEKVVRLFVIEFESSALIEASSLQLHVLSPQHDAGVAGNGDRDALRSTIRRHVTEEDRSDNGRPYVSPATVMGPV
jgi:hypothetical protein